MFGRHSDLLRKEVEVSAGGMVYKGILIEVTEEDVKLRGKTGWIILPFTQVRSISPANLGPKGFDPMRSVSSGFYDDSMQPGAPSPFAPAPPPAAPQMPHAPAFDAMGDLEPLTDLEPIPGAQLEELPVESFDAPPPRAPDPIPPARPAVPPVTARPPAPAPAPAPAAAPVFKPTPSPAPVTRAPAPPPTPATPRPSPPTSSSPPPRPAQAKPVPVPVPAPASRPVPVSTGTGVVPQGAPEDSSSVEDLFREFQLPKKPE